MKFSKCFLRFVRNGFTIKINYEYSSVNFDNALFTKRVVSTSSCQQYLVKRHEVKIFMFHNRKYLISFKDVNGKKVKVNLTYVSYQNFFAFYFLPILFIAITLSSTPGNILNLLFSLVLIFLFVPMLKHLLNIVEWLPAEKIVLEFLNSAVWPENVSILVKKQTK